MEHYSKLTGRRIPFTNVRGMSNWLHQVRAPSWVSVCIILYTAK